MSKISKTEKVWCDHCNAMIGSAGVNACLRADCKPKADKRPLKWK